MEGNVFTGVCFTARPWYGIVGTHPTGMLSCYQSQGKVMFLQVSVCPQSASFLISHCSSLLQRGRCSSYWNALLLLTAREGNVFTGFCHSVHNRPLAYSVTAHPCWLLSHLLQRSQYASYWNALLL